MSKKDASLSLRVPAEVKEALEKLSALDSRTVNNYVNKILLDYVVEKVRKPDGS